MPSPSHTALSHHTHCAPTHCALPHCALPHCALALVHCTRANDPSLSSWKPVILNWCRAARAVQALFGDAKRCFPRGFLDGAQSDGDNKLHFCFQATSTNRILVVRKVQYLGQSIRILRIRAFPGPHECLCALEDALMMSGLTIEQVAAHVGCCGWGSTHCFWAVAAGTCAGLRHLCRAGPQK